MIITDPNHSSNKPKMRQPKYSRLHSPRPVWRSEQHQHCPAGAGQQEPVRTTLRLSGLKGTGEERTVVGLRCRVNGTR